MITYNGGTELAKLFSGTVTVPFLYLAYGSGTTSESASHTALVTETGRVSASAQLTSTLSPYDTISLSGVAKTSALGTVNEVGVFNASSGGTMFSRKKLTTGVGYTAGQRIFMLVTIRVTDGGWQSGS